MIQNTIVALCLLAGSAAAASAQVVESVGNRALGMGGAFVAVATDSSATWWNPAGVAAGPFADISIGRSMTQIEEGPAPQRNRASWLAATATSFGFSYYRLRITDLPRPGTTGPASSSREDPRGEVSLRSFSTSQLGLTLVQTLFPGVHAGTTVKYVRGTLHRGIGDSAASSSDLLDGGEDLDDGDTENKIDLDVGVLAVAGPLRLGGVVRNLRAPTFADEFKLPRQARVGAAIDVEKAGGPPLTVAIDADLQHYTTVGGERRVIALGAEQWLFARSLGLRVGGRFNQVGARERAATAGVSIAVRNGVFVEGQIVRGGADEERGWGAGARVTF